MEQFTEALADIITERGGNQVAFAKECGLNASQISRFLGGKLPGMNTMQVLASHASSGLAARLVSAYLDAIRCKFPSDVANRIEVQPKGIIPKDELPKSLSAPVRGALVYLAKRSSEAPVREFILRSADLLK